MEKEIGHLLLIDVPLDGSHWELVYKSGETGRRLRSGDVIEVQVAEYWIRIRIEHGPVGYYALTPGVALYSGMLARLT